MKYYSILWHGWVSQTCKLNTVTCKSPHTFLPYLYEMFTIGKSRKKQFSSCQLRVGTNSWQIQGVIHFIVNSTGVDSIILWPILEQRHPWLSNHSNIINNNTVIAEAMVEKSHRKLTWKSHFSPNLHCPPH